MVYNVEFVQFYCFTKQWGRGGAYSHVYLMKFLSYLEAKASHCGTFRVHKPRADMFTTVPVWRVREWGENCQHRASALCTVLVQSKNRKQNASGMLATGHAGSSLGG